MRLPLADEGQQYGGYVAAKLWLDVAHAYRFATLRQRLQLGRGVRMSGLQALLLSQRATHAAAAHERSLGLREQQQRRRTQQEHWKNR